jgi:hypothetical protein
MIALNRSSGHRIKAFTVSRPFRNCRAEARDSAALAAALAVIRAASVTALSERAVTAASTAAVLSEGEAIRAGAAEAADRPVFFAPAEAADPAPGVRAISHRNFPETADEDLTAEADEELTAEVSETGSNQSPDTSVMFPDSTGWARMVIFTG